MNKRDRIIISALLAGFLGLLVKNAWISDDAFITFRSVQNFVAGHGPVWNLSERVQSFSHPLWMLSLSAISLVTREVYYSATALGIGVSLAAVLLVLIVSARSVKSGSSVLAVFVAWLLLTCSRAFVDYSTSGLENPLTHLLVVLFFWRATSPCRTYRDHLILGLIAALGATNRHDTVLIFIPVLLANLVTRGWFRILGVYLVAGLPFFLWEAFSVAYYGFPFPNTAYAKLSTGLPLADLLRQGSFYYLDVVKNDPITIVVIATGLLSACFGDRRVRLPLGLGLLLYLIYILRIGGDFMGGRFVSAPFILSLCLLASSRLFAWKWIAVPSLILTVAATLFFPQSPWRTGPDPRPQSNISDIADRHGIADERAFYYRELGLIPVMKRGGLRPEYEFVRIGHKIKASECRVALIETAGVTGVEMGPAVHGSDMFALTDPLLARLPAIQTAHWRIGHFSRRIPLGYIESLVFQENRIRDGELADFYDQLLLIARGPLFAVERWRAIARLNLGGAPDFSVNPIYQQQGDHLRWALALHYRAEDFLPASTTSGIPISPRGAAVHFRDIQNTAAMEVELSPGRRYQIAFFRDSVYVDSVLLTIPASEAQEFVGDRLGVPAAVGSGGYNSVLILPADDMPTPPYLKSLISLDE